MTEDNTRRTFVKAIGGASFTGIPSTLLGRSIAEDDTNPVAAEILLPEAELPEAFDCCPGLDIHTVPFVEALQSVDSRFKSSDIAAEGYWRGTDQSNPEWVVSSLAIVTEWPLPRKIVETATGQMWDEYVAMYDEETLFFVEFEQSFSRSERVSEWGLDIIQTPHHTDLEPKTTVIYTERLRLQFFENTLIGTIVFGPTGSSPSVESLLDQYAEIQRSRYRSYHSADN